MRKAFRELDGDRPRSGSLNALGNHMLGRASQPSRFATGHSSAVLSDITFLHLMTMKTWLYLTTNAILMSLKYGDQSLANIMVFESTFNLQ
jgi:hypothetical protein